MKKRLYVVVREVRKLSFMECKPIKIFQEPAAAMDFVMNTKLIEQNDKWELVGEGGYYDGINANKTEQEFTCENIYNGEIKVIRYYIESLYLEEE